MMFCEITSLGILTNSMQNRPARSPSAADQRQVRKHIGTFRSQMLRRWSSGWAVSHF